jgi:hypothetical protein
MHSVCLTIGQCCPGNQSPYSKRKQIALCASIPIIKGPSQDWTIATLILSIAGYPSTDRERDFVATITLTILEK